MGVKLREKIMKDKSSSLYLDIYHEGKRKYEFLNIHLSNKRKFSDSDREKKELAERLRIKRENELLVQEKVSFKLNKKNNNFFEFLQSYMKENNKLNNGSMNAFKKHITYYSENIFNISFRSLNEERVLDFQNYLSKTKSSKTTINYMSCFKQVLQSACEKGLLNNNPYDLISMNNRIKSNNDEVKEYLTMPELEKLIKSDYPEMPYKYKRIFLFSCFTGLRWSDVFWLKWDSIITYSKNKDFEKAIKFRQEKTEQVEYLPLSSQAIEILDELEENNHENSEYVFYQILNELKYRGPQAIYMKIWNLLKNWAKAAGINKNISFHTARHTFATLALTYGVDIYTVSKLLGHRNISTTTIYAKVVNEQKVKAVAKLPKLNFSKEIR